MPRLALCLFLSLSLCGCSNDSADAPPAESSNSGTAENGSPEPAESNTSVSQTVQGEGFTFQAPAGWQVQNLSSGISVNSPTDLAKGVPGVPISFGLLPTQPALPPDALIASLIKSDKNLGDVESETVVDVSGRKSHKLIMVKAYPSYTNRMIKLYVPLDNKVLLAQVQGDQKSISPVESEINSILSSLTVTP